MSFKDVQTALDTRLSLYPNTEGLDIAYEGTNYQIVTGSPFIRPTNITAISDTLELTNSVQLNVGIYQIDVFYPIDGTGTGQTLEVMEDLFGHFKAALTLTAGSGLEVIIRNVSRLTIVESEKTWMIGSIQVNYVSYF